MNQLVWRLHLRLHLWLHSHLGVRIHHPHLVLVILLVVHWVLLHLGLLIGVGLIRVIRRVGHVGDVVGFRLVLVVLLIALWLKHKMLLQ